MRWFVDRCMGKEVAEALRNAKHDIEWFHERFTDDRTPDDVWIPIVSAESKGILTKDLNIRHTPIEVAALHDACARCFMFPTKKQNAATLIILLADSWARMEAICEVTDPPFLYRIYADGSLRRRDTGPVWERLRAERAAAKAAEDSE